MEPKALKKKIRFKIPLRLESGLHIGGSETNMNIGGIDDSVLRDPITQEPIIPGSSIKGKMRSLTEKLLGAYHKLGMGVEYGAFQKSKVDVDDEAKLIIPKLYGTAAREKDNIPSRIIVRDSYLSQDSIVSLKKHSDSTDMLYTEVKTENTIDRVTAAATPRHLERVPAGVVFWVDIILNVFKDDDEQTLIDYVKVGLKLIEDDYLGGSGSRGSGHVKFIWDKGKINQKTQHDYKNGSDWQATIHELE